MDKKLLRALLWFAAAAFFITSLINADRGVFEERHNQTLPNAGDAVLTQ